MENIIYELISDWEEDNTSEEIIVKRLADSILEYPKSNELRFNINDALYQKGYSHQVELILDKIEPFDIDVFLDYKSQCGKSQVKTIEFIGYLYKMYRTSLSLYSLQFIKVKHLVNAGIFKHNSNYLKEHINDYLDDFYYRLYKQEYEHESDLKKYCECFFKNIGIEYFDEYIKFKCKVEYLLWTIKDSKQSLAYYKINTIKVAFNILPADYVTFGDKKHYNTNLSKYIIKYLSLIDKKEINRIFKNKTIKAPLLEYTGYKLLYNML